jgi:hypothetical protein
MYPFIRGSIFTLLLVLSIGVCAQDTLHKDVKKPGAFPVKKRVLLIPPEQKMYMSDIDRNINAETKLKGPEIREIFRNGVDNQLNSQFKSTYKVISLLKDTTKTNKDLKFIYKSIGYKFTPTQGKEKDGQKNITNGQITAPVLGDEERYMRTIINQPGLLEAMHKKYGAELFVFISEIDMKGAQASDPAPAREAWVHYTTYNAQAIQIGGGLAKVKFDSGLNDPKKITSQVLSVAAKIIYNHSIPPEPVPVNKTVPKGH